MDFSSATELKATEPGRFAAEVDATWSVGGKANGGYLLALLGRAAAETSTHPHPIAASAHYLRSPDAGAVTVETAVLREGRNATQLRARLLQGDTVCVEALITTAGLGESEPFWSAGLPAMPADAWDDCVRLPPVTPTGLDVPMMGEIDLRLEQATLGFGRGRPSGAGELRGWLALPDGEAFDPISLLFAVDAFPPATFEIAPSGWVPTLELSVYVRALPAPGPVRVLQQARLIDAGRVDEACFVWDSTGRLVAQATQLAGIRL
ncbi:MAG: thioesterase family protein [Jatrophihabitans sp.]|uniref:thioesterase family protein n=1 Tax=Jatrophihabitans sp. TaxID=1932789 RepID=UPI003F7F5B35